MRLFVFVLFLVFSCSAPLRHSPTEIKRWEKRAENVEIIRDTYGVGHIYAKTDADVVFGLLYAQCEDDFRRVERNYVWAIGRLAELEGPDALSSDIRANLFMTIPEAKELYGLAPAWLKELCVAFADGVNYYLYKHPEVEAKVIQRYEPWMPLFFSEGSIGGDIEGVSLKGIEEFYLNKKKVANIEFEKFKEPQGSNGIAISRELSSSGNAMLLINPHTSFFFRGEYHMVSEEGLNAYGAITWGQFFIYQGFNEKTGWMHTSTYTDVKDEYLETVEDSKEGKRTKFGQEWKPVDSLTVALSDGFNSRNFKLYRTFHGPVTGKEEEKWISTAMMWDPINALQQSYLRTKQSSYHSFFKIMEMKTNSSNNTVYADNDGNIAYFHGNFIPRRNIKYDFTKPVDGSIPETSWQGLHEVKECITLLNPKNGWIQNCNSTPFTAAAEFSPKKEDYPVYMTGVGENFRGIHAQNLLKEAKALTLDGLIKLAYDPHLPGMEAFVPTFLNGIPQYLLAKDEKKALDKLIQWDFKTKGSSVEMSMAHYLGLVWIQNTNGWRRNNILDEVNAILSKITPLERLQLFQKALAELKADFGSFEVPWGEINRYQRLNGDIQLKYDDTAPSTAIPLASGTWGALASYGATKKVGTKRIYGTSGNSFVAVVEFGEKVRAKSLLAGGQSSDPTSKHFDDQVGLYASGTFKEVFYYKEDVRNNALKSYKP